jgi:hypothetical protein
VQHTIFNDDITDEGMPDLWLLELMIEVVVIVLILTVKYQLSAFAEILSRQHMEATVDC